LKIRLLIISYHALPLDVVASYRTKAYCDYLFENGIYPTLITHNWKKDKNDFWERHEVNNETIIEDLQTHREIRLSLPFEAKTNSKLNTIQNWLKGNFETHLINSYNIYKAYIFKHLKESNYDAVLTIFSPHFHLKLAKEINNTFGIPFIADFRDLWDNQFVTDSYSPSINQLVQNRIIKYYWKKWLDQALFLSSTSHLWKNFLVKNFNNNVIVIKNGHEKEKLEEVQKTEKFTLTYFGRIYPYQNLETIINAIVIFIERFKPTDFKIQLIGVKKTGAFNGLDIFKNSKLSDYLEVIEYLPKNKLLEFCIKNTSIFILPNLKEDNGSFFVKLFDYISLNKPIILAPNNGSENDLVVKSLENCIVSSSQEEIVQYLINKYTEYKNKKGLSSICTQENLMKFHRKNQIREFSNYLKLELRKR
jgi:glycosyltransferase involved in cell wall biosynthesis